MRSVLAGNPFAEDDQDLYNVYTRQCCGQDVVQTVMSIEEKGKAQYVRYCQERLESSRVSLHAPITRNNLPTFARSQKSRTKDPKTQKIRNLRNEVQLFSSMWVAESNNRPGDLDEFFASETDEFPSATSVNGVMREANKADLLNLCLGPLLKAKPSRCPPVDVKMVDGAVLVHMLKPTNTCQTFADYLNYVFIPHVIRQCQSIVRLDLVWDE